MGPIGFFQYTSGAEPSALTAEFSAYATHSNAHPFATKFTGAGCWGPVGQAADTVALALKGTPLWRGSTGAEYVAASPQSILDAYRREGVRFLRGLCGRFALALLDVGERRTILAIDPMGIERLTYAFIKGVLVFGESAEWVARAPSGRVAIHAQAVFDYLMMHMVPAPATIFAGVNKIGPACCVIVEEGKLRTERYWTPSFSTERRSQNDLREELFAALRVGVRASGPDNATGAFLSGGLDSSTVAGVLQEVGPRPAKTFSIGFGYADYDELEYARIANRHFGCIGHEYTIHGDDIVESFASIARAYDEPFGNSSALPAHYCARFAKQHDVDHLLAGDGGDELFAGNSRYAEQQVFEHYQRAPKLLRKGLLEPALALWPGALDFVLTRKARGYIEKANIPLPARLETWNVVQRLGAKEMLTAEFAGSIDTHRPFETMQSVWDSTPSDSLLHRMLYYDWHYTLADNDLRKVEAMSRLAGVHVSYPMLHPAVVDMSTRIAPDVMMPGNKLRHFYKEAAANFLPQSIIHKKKHGFGLPFGLWLQESASLRELIYGNLNSLRRRGIIRESFIDRLLNLHGSEDARYYGVFLWVLAMLEQWFQEHKVAP